MESTSETATRYNSSYQTEMNWLDSVDSKSKSMQLMDNTGAKRKINPHMVCSDFFFHLLMMFLFQLISDFCFVLQTLYNSVIEEKITIEQVNTMGARLAKEAKVWVIFMSFLSVRLIDWNVCTKRMCMIRKACSLYLW